VEAERAGVEVEGSAAPGSLRLTRNARDPLGGKVLRPSHPQGGGTLVSRDREEGGAVL